MASFENNTHVFIVRIWLEPRQIEDATAEWRGVVEHIPSGERRYMRDLDEIVAFIAPYLAEMGIRVGLRWRMKEWLKQWKLHLLRQG